MMVRRIMFEAFQARDHATSSMACIGGDYATAEPIHSSSGSFAVINWKEGRIALTSMVSGYIL